MSSSILRVTCECEGMRLDHFLTLSSADVPSRTFVTRVIKEGLVTLNGVVVTKPSIKLRVDDQVTLQMPPPAVYATQPQPLTLDIIEQHDDFLVLNKPAGLLVHHVPTKPEEASLVQGLLYHFAEFADFSDQERPGIVHRLDRDTSGLLVVARNPKAHARLAGLFKDRLIKKTYYAFVKGHTERSGIIDSPVGRDPLHRNKMCVGGIAPREALTEYKVVSYGPDYTYLELFPHTGRTHQIRVHCASLGHPLLADKLYQGPVVPALSRHALHAGQLSFEYNGTPFTFTAPLPSDLTALVPKECDSFREEDLF